MEYMKIWLIKKKNITKIEIEFLKLPVIILIKS